jgi:hypothetical protein
VAVKMKIKGGEGRKENDGGVNSTMIYCKNFYKYHNVPQHNNLKNFLNPTNTHKKDEDQ